MAVNTIQREQLVHVASEVTYGTDPTGGAPTTFAAMIACSIKPIREFRQDQSVRGVHSPGPHISLPSHCDVECEFYVTGRTGALGTAPWWAPYLKAANFKETVNAGVSVSYKPVTITDDMTSVPSLTIYCYQKLGNGQVQLLKSTGVRGNLSFTIEHGQRIRCRFVGKGIYHELGTPIASPANPTVYQAGAGLLAQGMVITLDAEPMPLESLEINTNWGIEEIRTATGASNLDGVVLKRGEDSALGGSFNFKSRDLINYCAAQYQLDSILPLAAQASNAGGIVEFNAPALQLGQWSPTPGNLYAFAVPYWLRGDFGTTSGEDDLEIVFK